MEDAPVHTPDIAPDVLLTDFTRFETPDVPLAEIELFDTDVPHRKGIIREWLESLAFTVVLVLIKTK
jgi:hypothetical protein